MNHGSESGSAGRGADDLVLGASDLPGQLLRLSSRVQTSLDEESGGLLELQTRFIGHYFRLQRAERNLSNLTQASRPAAAISAVRLLEKERERLGRDLHTGVGQLLVAIRLQLEVIASQLANPPGAVQQALNRIATLADDAGQQVRALARRVHPPDWQRLTLQQAVEQLWATSGIPERFQASLRIDPLPREPEQEIKVLVYRAVQEAMTNLVRHSRASGVELTIHPEGDNISLQIHDNGVGFDSAGLLNGPAHVEQGIGLRSIRDQAAALGGKLEITSGPEGTLVQLTLPVVVSNT